MNESAEATIGARIRLFREAKGMTQAEMAKVLGGTTSGLKQNEQGVSMPNSKVLMGLYDLGANTNWLLSGDGPMLRSDLRKHAGKSPPVNVDALIKAFEVMMQTARPGETPAQTARKAVEFYLYLLSSGMITSDGVGEGNLSNAA